MNDKAASAPKIGKIGRTGSARTNSEASLQKSRVSTKQVDSKPTVERRMPKVSNPKLDKQARVKMGNEAEDVKKVKEEIASLKQENGRVLEELKYANEKLQEAVKAQENAEKNLEIEKLHANELEQANIESTRKRDEELDSTKKKHFLEVESLAYSMQELEKVKDELEIAKKEKYSNAEKVDALTAENTRLKSLKDGHASDVVKKLYYEIDCLKDELERAKQAEEKLVIMDSLVERLSNEADNAKSAEVESLKLVEEWKRKAEMIEASTKASLRDSEFANAALKQKVESLEQQLEEVKQCEKSLNDSKTSLEKELEEVNASLQDAESEIEVLKGKIESLEIEVAAVNTEKVDSVKLVDELKSKIELFEKQLAEANESKESSSDSLASITKQLEESNSSLHDVLSDNSSLRIKIETLELELEVAKQETGKMCKEVEELQGEIIILKEDNLHALNSDEGRNDLMKELEFAKGEEQKAKNAMEDLTTALHELSLEARDAQERLLEKRVENENVQAQIEQLRSTLNDTKENYEVMLDEARYEIVCLKKAIEKLKECEEEEGLDSSKSQTTKTENDVEIVKELESISNSTKEDAEEIKKSGSNELSFSENDYDLLPNLGEILISSVNDNKEEIESSDERNHKEGNGNASNQYLGEEEPVEVEVKMWEGYKEAEKDKEFSSENENETESLDDESDVKTNGHTNGVALEQGEDVTGSQKKKKSFFKNLLKKKSPSK